MYIMAKKATQISACCAKKPKYFAHAYGSLQLMVLNDQDQGTAHTKYKSLSTQRGGQGMHRDKDNASSVSSQLQPPPQQAPAAQGMLQVTNNRNIQQYKQLSALLAQTNLSSPFLDKPPRLIGAGSYNDVFLVKCKGHQMVLRLSYYSPYTLSKVQALIRQHLPYKQLMQRAHKITALDPVKVKNNYSNFCNVLIEQQVCPHFVYMYHQKDVKCFAALVKDQIKPERQRNNLSFRYNNVSFHEKFQTSLRLKLRQMTDVQLAVAIFQVLYGLAILQHYLPDFRHNDLSLDNVLVTTYPAKQSEYIHYKLGGNNFWLPDVGIFAAVTDFDLAHAPVTIVPGSGKPYSMQNQLIAKDQFGNHTDMQARNINAKPNKSFDTYYFLYRLKEALGNKADGAISQWLATNNVLKTQAKAKYISDAFPVLYPSVMLANAPIFAQFRRHPALATNQTVTSYQPKALPVKCVAGDSCTSTRTNVKPTHSDQAQRKVTMNTVLSSAK